MAFTRPVLAKKTPQCRHNEEFLVRSIKSALFNVECRNCGSEAGHPSSYEEARWLLMKIEAAPLAYPLPGPTPDPGPGPGPSPGPTPAGRKMRAVIRLGQSNDCGSGASEDGAPTVINPTPLNEKVWMPNIGPGDPRRTIRRYYQAAISSMVLHHEEQFTDRQAELGDTRTGHELVTQKAAAGEPDCDYVFFSLGAGGASMDALTTGVMLDNKKEFAAWLRDYCVLNSIKLERVDFEMHWGEDAYGQSMDQYIIDIRDKMLFNTLDGVMLPILRQGFPNLPLPRLLIGQLSIRQTGAQTVGGEAQLAIALELPDRVGVVANHWTKRVDQYHIGAKSRNREAAMLAAAFREWDTYGHVKMPRIIGPAVSVDNINFYFSCTDAPADDVFEMTNGPVRNDDPRPQPAYVYGKYGFQFEDGSGVISDVEVTGSPPTFHVTCSTSPKVGAKLTYAGARPGGIGGSPYSTGTFTDSRPGVSTYDGTPSRRAFLSRTIQTVFTSGNDPSLLSGCYDYFLPGANKTLDADDRYTGWAGALGRLSFSQVSAKRRPKYRPAFYNGKDAAEFVATRPDRMFGAGPWPQRSFHIVALFVSGALTGVNQYVLATLSTGPGQYQMITSDVDALVGRMSDDTGAVAQRAYARIGAPPVQLLFMSYDHYGDRKVWVQAEGGPWKVSTAALGGDPDAYAPSDAFALGCQGSSGNGNVNMGLLGLFINEQPLKGNDVFELTYKNWAASMANWTPS